jgi:hypothetical protein
MIVYPVKDSLLQNEVFESIKRKEVTLFTKSYLNFNLNNLIP